MFAYYSYNQFTIIILQALGESTTDKVIITILLVLFGITSYALYRNRNMNAELQKKTRIVQEQALQITDKNKRLEDKNRTLQSLNEEKNNIMGVVSHDLRAPLNRIFALSNLIYLSDDNLNPEQKNYLEKVNLVVSESLNMIRNFLDIRAIEYHGIKINKEEVDLDKLLRQLVSTYKTITKEKGQKISYQNDYEEDLFIESDRQYLNRIFDNLISNAVKFSREDKEIKVVLVKESGSIKIRIEDKGPGISPQDQQKLFQKFQVLTARPTGGESSTGLGLSITKSLVTMLDGSVYFEDNPGGGSVFVVDLPVLTHA